MKIVLELELAEDEKDFTPEQWRFIERNAFRYIQEFLEAQGLGKWITPEVDWDNDDEANKLFGDSENGENEEILSKHLDGMGTVISVVDGLYDAMIDGIRSRGGETKSIYD
jgi:hypothetical protein